MNATIEEIALADESLIAGEPKAMAADGNPTGEPSYGLSERLELISGGGSVAAESISTLLSQLLAKHVQDARRGVAFCAATKGAGCSYMAANIAVAMALSGIDTVLIDANLRDPSIQDYVTPETDRGGLLQCLMPDGAALSDVIHRQVIPNLSIVYAGGTSRESGLLASTRAREIFTECLRDFAFTVVDTPPANRNSDALRIANMIRYALVVARKNRTYLGDLRKLVSDLEANRGTVLGSYLNDY